MDHIPIINNIIWTSDDIHEIMKCINKYDGKNRISQGQFGRGSPFHDLDDENR